MHAASVCMVSCRHDVISCISLGCNGVLDRVGSSNDVTTRVLTSLALNMFNNSHKIMYRRHYYRRSVILNTHAVVAKRKVHF